MNRFLAVIFSLVSLTSYAQDQAYPVKPIRLLVGYAPGGATDIVAALYNASINALQSQDIKDKMEAQGAEPVGNNPEEFKSFVKTEIDKWEQVIIKSGAKMD